MHARMRQCLSAIALSLAGWMAHAAPPTDPPGSSQPDRLPALIAAAWSRLPELRSLDARLDSTKAASRAADSWSAEPPALELNVKSDRLTGNRGGLEVQAGVAIPLWLPGQRLDISRLAGAERAAIQAKADLARLKVAGTVREAFWAWQRVLIEEALALSRLDSARKIAEDAARRVRGGDLARADLRQAESIVASAQASLAQTRVAVAGAARPLREILGRAPVAEDAPQPGQEGAAVALAELEPAEADGTSIAEDRHPALVDARARVEQAERALSLARSTSRANPELTLAAVRERAMAGDAYQHGLVVGIRVPFASEARQEARTGAARAEQLESLAQLEQERARLGAEATTARDQLILLKRLVQSAQERQRLALATRDFAERAFRLGESDLATRYRLESDATEAERQLALARIEVAAGVSSLRQALGLTTD